ncbi:hypothetical protein [Algibacillus agarilyticus]|nr:hypothetical protein [Algibacillus agarilyticus]
MYYRFEIDPDLIPDDALDHHVKRGGEYFSPLYGGICFMRYSRA